MGRWKCDQRGEDPGDEYFVLRMAEFVFVNVHACVCVCVSVIYKHIDTLGGGCIVPSQ